EGLPFGFQAFALPIYLRESGRSLVAIGFLGALSAPWMLKPLWAPLVDRYGTTRRSWIVPLLAALAATCGAAGLLSPRTEAGLAELLALVFLMNLLAATMDIAIDGLAVDLLGPEELGAGNAAQVVGYKVGMLSGGGLFVWASARFSWQVLLASMGVLIVGVMAVAAAAPATRTRAHAPQPLARVGGDLVRALRAPGGGRVLAYPATYQLGGTTAR